MANKRKRVRRFSTWADAEMAYDIANKMSNVLDIALAELVRGQVQWIQGEQPRKIGLCKLRAAHGGVVILVEREMIGARYLDEWANEVQTRPSPPHTKGYQPEYNAWLDIRRLATKAKDEQRIVHEQLIEEAKGCARPGAPSIVDQSVPKY